MRQFKGIKTTAEGYLIQAQALIKKQPIWWGDIVGLHQQGGWMFDIETNPESQALWSIAWCDPQGHMMCIVVGKKEEELVIDNGLKVHVARSVTSAWNLFADYILHDGLPVYHWSPYDASRFRREALDEAQQRIGSRLTDLARLVHQSVKLPLVSSSLKTVAPFLGFEYSGHTSFLQAWKDYQIWLRKQQITDLQIALRYVCDDVQALRTVYQWWTTQRPPTQ